MGLLSNVGNGAAVGSAISPGLGTVIGAGVGLVGSGLSALSSDKANKRNVALQRETNQLNAELARENYQLQRDLLERNLQYASPQNQREMLEAAGYNPYDFVDGTGSKPVAATPSPQLPTMVSAQVAPVDYGLGLTRAGSEIAQYYNLYANAKKTNAEAIKQEIDNEYESAIKATELTGIGLDNVGKDIVNKYNSSSLDDRVINNQLQNDLLRSQNRQEIAKAAQLEIDNLTRDKKNIAEIDEIRESVNLLIEKGITEQSMQELNRAGVSKANAEIARIAVQNAVDLLVGRAQANYYNKAATKEVAERDKTIIERKEEQLNLKLKEETYEETKRKIYWEFRKMENDAKYVETHIEEVKANIKVLEQQKRVFEEQRRKLYLEGEKINFDNYWRDYEEFMQLYHSYMNSVSRLKPSLLPRFSSYE